MSRSAAGVRAFFVELKRRRVFRVAAAYAVVAWVMVQVVATVLPAFGLPTWTLRLVIVLAVLGFPVAVALAWAFDLTPEGVERTGSLEESAGEVRTSRSSSVKWALAGLVVLAVAASGWLGWRRWGSAPAPRVDPEVVAVLPFRVAGADPSLGYLREGMLDLLAAKLTGEAGPRAVDPRTLMSAWRRAAGEAGGDLPRDTSLALARSLGAGRAVLGEVVSLPGRVVLTASLADIGSGRVEAPVSVEGPPDSLPALVDRLVAALLSVGAGEGGRLASLTTGSLPALRQYLEGQADFRGGRYDEAFTRFSRAVEIDSTFALAALMASQAAGWLPSMPPEARDGALALAWRHRERLGERDRVLLTAVAGPDYPAYSSTAELLAAREALVRARPDSPEAWFNWGDELLHRGAFLDIPDSTAVRRAASAFSHALAPDSLYLPALDHLFDIAVVRGDTADMRRHGDQYLARDPSGLLADKIRNVRAAWAHGMAARPEILARTDSGGGTLQIYTIGFLSFDPRTASVGHAVADHLGSRIEDPEIVGEVGWALYGEANNRGRPAEAARYLRSRRRAGQIDSLEYLAIRVRDGLYWDGEADVAARAAESLALQLERLPADSPNRNAFCVLGQWQLAQGETNAVAPIIGRLRSAGGSGESVEEASALRCAELLGTWRAAALRAPDTPARIARLDSLLATGYLGGRITHEANLVLARLLEARGDRTGALRVLGRYPAFLADFPAYYSSFLRERGRVAALLGDTAAATRAYRHYLAMRANAEPRLRPEVARIRAEGARLPK